MKTDAKTAAARAFVRSLNILLKYARLYGFEHTRTTAQFQTAWGELRAAVGTDEGGLLLGATGTQLLLDGVPLEAAPTERSFAQLLSAAGLASIHFSSKVTQDDLARFARAFPTGNSKPTALAEQLKAVLAGVSGIRINEIRFVAEDAALADVKTAAQLTATALGADAEQFKQWLNDPQKLLQLITAAQGARSGFGAPGAARTPSQAARTAAAVVEAPTSAAGLASGGKAGVGLEGAGGATVFAPQEDEVLGVLRVLTQIGQIYERPGAPAEPGMLQEQVAKLPERAQEVLRQALAVLAAQAPSKGPDAPMLLKLAEHLAVRFALDRYEHGEVRVNAVRQMLDRMNQEIEGLRKLLGAHEERMAKAGLMVESHVEILDRQFWAGVPESGKRAVLLSPEAWCIPPRNVRTYIEELFRREERAVADSILLNYAGCITNPDPEARRKTALGLGELAELYARGEGRALVAALRQLGMQMCVEREAELQSLVSSSFARLSQEAATQRCYVAMQQALSSLDSVENQRPALGETLRPRLGVENRLPEFVEEALRAEQIPEGLADLLRLMPRLSAEYLTARFNRSSNRKDCDRLVELAQALGPAGTSQLRDSLRIGPSAEAVETVGLLSRLDAAATEQFLPGRLHEWQRPAHDRVVRLLAAGGAPERGRLLVAALEAFDQLILSLAIDEIGMCGDASTAGPLLPLAEGNLPQNGTPYLRLKAIEALGRVRATPAAATLKKILEARQLFRWTHPRELRIAAAQALERIDPDWAQEFLPRSGLDAVDLSMAPLDAAADSTWFRQRRYQRIRLVRPVAATATCPKETCRLEIKGASLSGGLATTERHLAPGTQMTLKLQSGWSSLRATVLMRDSRAQDVAFEIVEMALEDRSKLRRLLVENLSPATAMEQGLTGRRPGRAQIPAR
ncbi:MAG: hypothetical protein HY237_04115 [Acidobacteria bacterium]|nr:hypothetical protein [Acidobacteriota bacterium]